MEHAILIVEDEEAVLFALSDYFRFLGYRVDCAREREEAEALLAHRSYSLVIADVCLTGYGGGEGLELIGFIREREPAVPILLLSGHLSPQIEREARRRGADAVLPKPQSLPALARVAEGLMRSA